MVAFLKPRMKAVVPFLVTITTLLIDGAFVNDWNTDSIRIAVVGLAATFLTWLIPNTAV